MKKRQIIYFLLFLLVPIVYASCPSGMSGSGTAASPCMVTNCIQLHAGLSYLPNDPNYHIELANDIDCYFDTREGGQMWENSKGWKNLGLGFSGEFDGNNYQVFDIFMNRFALGDCSGECGLFEHVKSTGYIHDVFFVNAEVWLHTQDVWALMVGTNHGTIERVITTGEVHGNVGGRAIVHTNYGTLSDSSTLATVNGMSASSGSDGEYPLSWPSLCKPNGMECGVTECCSGNCVDGVCCSSSSCATCQSCDVSGSEGSCTVNECEPCGGQSRCDSSGSCIDPDDNSASAEDICENPQTCMFVPTISDTEGYWSFDSNLNSDWGPNNAVIVSGSVQTSSGKIGNALKISNQKIKILDNASLDPKGNDFSWSFWIKKNSNGGGVLDKYIKGTFDKFFIIDKPTGALRLHISDVDTGGQVDISSNVLSTGQWYHVVVSVDFQDKARLYIDGSEVASDTMGDINFVDNYADLWIGCGNCFDYSRPVGFMDGYIDELMLFSKALSSSEVLKLNQQTSYALIEDCNLGCFAAEHSYLNEWTEWETGTDNFCCGDDPNEYLITTGENTACCTSPTFFVDSSGECSDCISIEGECDNSTRLGCSIGTANDSAYPDSAEYYKWSCDGNSCGTDSGLCALGIPVNGVCDNSIRFGCISGGANDGAYSDTVDYYRWQCDGLFDGTDSTMCEIAKNHSRVLSCNYADYRYSESSAEEAGGSKRYISDMLEEEVDFSIEVWSEDLNYQISCYNDLWVRIAYFTNPGCCDWRDTDDGYGINHATFSCQANKIDVKVIEGGSKSSTSLGYDINYRLADCDDGCTCTGIGCTDDFDGTYCNDCNWLNVVNSETIANGNCGDGKDNDCDGYSDWDNQLWTTPFVKDIVYPRDIQNNPLISIHGEQSCPVRITSISIGLPP